VQGGMVTNCVTDIPLSLKPVSVLPRPNCQDLHHGWGGITPKLTRAGCTHHSSQVPKSWTQLRSGFNTPAWQMNTWALVSLCWDNSKAGALSISRGSLGGKNAPFPASLSQSLPY
jgi:hypothetical protein